jgi:hypothetical protein
MESQGQPPKLLEQVRNVMLFVSGLPRTLSGQTRNKKRGDHFGRETQAPNAFGVALGL